MPKWGGRPVSRIKTGGGNPFLKKEEKGEERGCKGRRQRETTPRKKPQSSNSQREKEKKGPPLCTRGGIINSITLIRTAAGYRKGEKWRPGNFYSKKEPS